MIRMASLLSFTDPMCQPPRQRMETFSFVRPRIRVGMPVAPDDVCARTFSAREAATADPKTNSKNSRLDFEFIDAPSDSISEIINHSAPQRPRFYLKFSPCRHHGGCN